MYAKHFHLLKSAIRMKYYDKELLKNAPASFKHTDAKGKEFAGY